MAVNLYSNIANAIVGLSDFGKARWRELDNTIVEQVKAGKMLKVYDEVPVDKMLEMTTEQTAQSIPQMMWEDMYILDGLNNLGVETAKSFQEASRLINRNYLLAGGALIGVGILGYYVYTKFKEQEKMINDLALAGKNLCESQRCLAEAMHEHINN